MAGGVLRAAGEEAGGQELDPECKLCGRDNARGKRVGRGAESRAFSAAGTSDNQPQRSSADDGELLSQCEADGNSVHGCAVPNTGGQATAREGGRPTTMRAGDSGDLPSGSLGLSIRGECVHAACVRPAKREVCRDWASFTTGENGQDAGSHARDGSLGATAGSGCKRDNVQESCTNSVATGRRSGSARRKEPGAETKASFPGGREVASGKGEAMGVESRKTLRGTVHRSCHPMARLTSTQHQQCTLAVDEDDCRTSSPDEPCNSLRVLRRGEAYQCMPAGKDIAHVRKAMASPEAALVCRCRVDLAGSALATCLDTGATFSLLSDAVYSRLEGRLPPLQPANLMLTGAGGESLDVKGQCLVDLSLAGAIYQQTVYVGRLEGLDLLLGMDFLTTYEVELDCGAWTV